MSPEEKLDELLDFLSERAEGHDQSIPKQEIAQKLESLGFTCGDEWEEKS